MEDLFDVFDEKTDQHQPHIPENQLDLSKKRRLNGHRKNASNGDKLDNAVGDIHTEGSTASKRQRRDSDPVMHDQDAEPLSTWPPTQPEPKLDRKGDDAIVADTFETEQSREVTASAGLQATKEQEPLVLSHQVRHQVSLPANYNYLPLAQHKPPAEPAKKFKFTLDPFQQVSVTSIERNESVLVSAHTSAGKTVVAEYAIAQCLKNNQRVIYTSPIKALSNQKYRDFMAEFGDVGLMTGDVTINPTATCLVMTTEILRSMLYRGSEIMREVAWVVFDEVHYLRDKARGVVWEETIILLPDNVRYVFLSATIPNAMQFAEWITKIHRQPCHVVYTDFRPTPLQHYLFPAGADGIHLVVDEKGAFREDNFSRAMNSLVIKQGDNPPGAAKNRKGKGKDKRMNRGGGKGDSDIYKIVKMIMQRSYNPVIVFSFSKVQCESYALQMSQLAFNDDTEKELVSKVFNGAIEMLSEADRELPQIKNLLPLLRRGIGIHHSGLLPILKETIEILFQESLIKVLFATETFSIGLNMPAKTVVFTSVRKFDGKDNRWVTPSEFIQMSGRAGRRGIDERGIVIMMIDEKMEPSVAKEIVRGEQDNLNSEFHLGYNMILNLVRVEGFSPEFMLESCFYQFQNMSSVSGLERELDKAEADRNAIVIEDEKTIREYYDLRSQLSKLETDMKEVISHPTYCIPYMKAGRLIRVRYKEHDFGWAVIQDCRKRDGVSKQKASQLSPSNMYQITAYVSVADDTKTTKGKRNPDLPTGIRPPGQGEASTMQLVPILMSCVDGISKLILKMPEGESPDATLAHVRRNLQEATKRFPDGVPQLDPIVDMKIKDESFKKLMRKIEMLDHKLHDNALFDSAKLPQLYTLYETKKLLKDKVKTLTKKVDDAHAIMQLEELKKRLRVLRRLGFLDDSGVVQLKARVACEISTGDELVLSELLFNGFFNELSPEVCVAVLSVFVFEEKVKSPPRLPDELNRHFLEIKRLARNVAEVSQSCKMPVNVDEYLLNFKCELMEVVLAWSKGASFAAICQMTDVYEGSLIRIFRRLEELIRQIAQAAKVIGNEDLEKKFGECLGLLRRDIVAAQSLYL